MNEANAKKLLFEVADTLEDIGVEFFLYGGTLLGAVRERKFIEIDKDIDLGIWRENLIPVAREIEARLIEKRINVNVIDSRKERPWNNGIYAIKFKAYGEHGDLGGFMKLCGKRAIPSRIKDSWLVHTARFIEELDEIEFYGRTFKCPKDTDGFLTEKYGDWRTPHKVFHNVSKSTCRKPESWIEDMK